jgi:hypothetical protein
MRKRSNIIVMPVRSSVRLYVSTKQLFCQWIDFYVIVLRSLKRTFEKILQSLKCDKNNS